MRIRIDVELPQWTQWLVAGAALGLVFGVGTAKVRADTSGLKTNWQAHQRLTASDLNANFAILQGAIQQLETPECPQGYSKDTSNTTITLCKKGRDEMVRVGSGGAAFWIDRYEASIWESSNGTGKQYGLTAQDFPSDFPANGQYTTELYAVSRADVTPSAWLSWFLADAACEASGKRLPTTSEWLRAARNTPDPGSTPGTSFTCVTSATKARTTGQGAKCSSMWGAQDMIGNLHEYAAEWHMAPSGESTHVNWPDDAYNGDLLWCIGSSAADANGYHPGVPATTLHGGSFTLGYGAGIFALNLGTAPNYGSGEMGVRCVVHR